MDPTSPSVAAANAAGPYGGMVPMPSYLARTPGWGDSGWGDLAGGQDIYMLQRAAPYKATTTGVRARGEQTTASWSLVMEVSPHASP